MPDRLLLELAKLVIETRLKVDKHLKYEETC